MQKEQLLQQIIDQQTVENQKQTMEFLHANKGVEALGVLVQYLVFNVSTNYKCLLKYYHIYILMQKRVSLFCSCLMNIYAIIESFGRSS